MISRRMAEREKGRGRRGEGGEGEMGTREDQLVTSC